MKVALLHNARPAHHPEGFSDDAFEEYDRPETIAAIASALELLDVDVEPVPADRRLPWLLDEGRFDFAFNIAEGAGGRCREAVPAAVCELFGVPTTGSDALALAVTLDKAMTRRVVSPDVPVAPALLVESDEDERGLDALAYPAIVKPNDEGSSKGIRAGAVVGDPAEAAVRCRSLRAAYGGRVLVEQYLPGIEVTAGITGNGAGAAVLGLMEIAPTSHAERFVYSLEVKRDYLRRVRYHMPPRLPTAVLAGIERLALTAYRLLGLRDVARMDFRLDADGAPHFIECNALPGLDPDNSDIVFLATPTRTYAQLVQGILIDATERVGVPLR